MKRLLLIIVSCFSLALFSQNNKERLLAEKASNNHVYEANALANNDAFISAEMEYRKAISKKTNNIAGMYNLGNSYYKSGNLEEALYRHQQTTKLSSSKEEKHKAFHNIGNILMQTKKCKEAVEAYKNALRNNPKDNETRYNLGIAKACAEQEKQDEQNNENKDDKNKDQNEKNENKENKDKKEDKDKEGDKKDDKKDGEDKEDKNKDDGDEDKKEDEKDDDKNKEKDKNKGDKGDNKEQPKPQPKPGQLSPQQIKSLLDAMNNQEQKVQEKMNAEKQKGIKIKTDKDW